MKRLFQVRNLAIAIVLFSLVLLAGGAVLLTPHVCFAESATFGKVTICSDAPVDPRWQAIVEQAMGIVERSELYTTDSEFYVLLEKDSTYGGIAHSFVRPVMAKAARHTVFLNGDVDLEGGRLIGPVLSMDLVRTLAHELTHCLEDLQYGPLATSNVASWKREGYAEYIAHALDRESADYRLEDVVALHDEKAWDGGAWIDLHDGIMLPPDYIRARAQVEYLMEVKGMTYDAIIASDLTRVEVDQQLRRWLGTQIH